MRFTSNIQQKLSSKKARCSDEFPAKCFVFNPERTPAVALGNKERHCHNSHSDVSKRILITTKLRQRNVIIFRRAFLELT
jgi:hypothetical protein